ncbi:UDP-galactose transporter Gms1 [Friedmanniomyces endolithicus]|nr:UDP-galactose transporter Gms1 [Friedmanniomyces endolithicus]
MPLVDRPLYYISTAVFLSEVLKLATSLSLALYDIARDPHTLEDLTVTGLFTKLGQVVQTTLQYIGVSNLDAATFQVPSQLQLLAIALFDVTVLGRSLSRRKRLALLMLTVGIAIMQIPMALTPGTKALSTKDLEGGVAFHSPRNIWDFERLGNTAAGQLAKRSATYEGIDVDDAAGARPELNPQLGLIAVVLACSLFGVASVYLEKSEVYTASVWVRNVQLSFYSIWPALFIGVFFKDGEHIAKTGFYAGYNLVVWLAIISQALGGIVVALVINCADNITINLAASISTIVTIPASVAFFDFPVSFTSLLGTSVILSATYLYNTTPEVEWRPPPIYITGEKSGEQSYFDLESVTVAGKSSMRNEPLSTSRPATPTYERRPKLQTPGVCR